MRFHVVSLPHTNVSEEFSACAFNEKVRKFCIMMHDILGHEVYLYSPENSTAPCTQHIICLSEKKRKEYIDTIPHYTQASFDNKLPHWVEFNNNAILGIAQRIKPTDFICNIGGLAHEPVVNSFPWALNVEFGIGYPGAFCKYKVWESYAWMHHKYGEWHLQTGNWQDDVIPSYFEVEKFPYVETKEDYYLFVGRIVNLKGINIASKVCQMAGKKLIIVGPVNEKLPLYGQHVGIKNREETNELMSKATALIAPTVYIEPFGSVSAEAQLCGTPVISTDWGAFTETVEQGKTGFRCRSFQEFTDALDRVKDLDPGYIRQRAIEKYSLESVAKQYDEYFTRILNFDNNYRLLS